MDGNGWKGWKWLEIDENGCEWLHIAVDCQKLLKQLDIAENCWKWLEMAGNGWKKL